MVGTSILREVEKYISDFAISPLSLLYTQSSELVIKFVSSQWAVKYMSPGKLKISEKPALTWGTATYVTPLCFPLSSGLYGRIGLVCKYDPAGWRVFDATQPSANAAYIKWARTQPAYQDLLLTVHSTYANHLLRNKFRTDFRIDCVLFHPDQEAEAHTNVTGHTWMAVTDWVGGIIDNTLSNRFSQALFSALIDEDFKLSDDGGLPVRLSARQIEPATSSMLTKPNTAPIGVVTARPDLTLPSKIAAAYHSNGYVHIYIEP